MFQLRRSSRRRNHLRDDAVSEFIPSLNMERDVPDTSNTCCTSPKVCHHREQKISQMVGRVGHARAVGKGRPYDVSHVRPGCTDLALECFGRYGHVGAVRDSREGKREMSRENPRRAVYICSTESSNRSLSYIKA